MPSYWPMYSASGDQGSPDRVPPFGYLWIYRLHTGSPELFAVCHALLRLLAPRHPPYALSSLTHMKSRNRFVSRPIQLLRCQIPGDVSPVAEPHSLEFAPTTGAPSFFPLHQKSGPPIGAAFSAPDTLPSPLFLSCSLFLLCQSILHRWR